MFNLRNLINKFDRMMAAITFAEAGESEKALDILYDQPEKKKERRISTRIPSRKKPGRA